MKKYLPTIGLMVLMAVGAALLLYPGVSNWWNQRHASRVIATYEQELAGMELADYSALWADARAYNRELAEHFGQSGLSERQRKIYASLLNVNGSGVMGYLEIEKLGILLPIYHGTDEAVLQVAVGHVDWTSLPAGGAGTHCVLSGHCGLPSAKLLSDLDRLKRGDTFTLHVLDRTLHYMVDRIEVVTPGNTAALQLDEDRDYCTLITCTPYGVNTHRLLVRGSRVEGDA